MSTKEHFIQQLPKAELHVHIEGTLEPELMFALSKKNKVALPYASLEDIHDAYQFENLQSFLDLYYLGAGVLQSQQDFYDLTYAYLEKAHQDTVKHVEIFFDPQTHTDRGISFSTVIEGIHQALQEGQKNLGISFKLILCFLRHLSEDAAIKTLAMAKPYLHLIEAVGLDSSEVGHPPEKFKSVFQMALDLGLKTVAHAGEEGPPEYIWQALNLLKVSRVDHGVRCLEDPLLVEKLRQLQIPLTVCPLSNVKLKVFQSIQDHNIHKLIQAGLLVTINSDDPAYFGGSVGDNYQAIAKTFNLSIKDMAQLAKNSFSASFLSDVEKGMHTQAIDTLMSSYS